VGGVGGDNEGSGCSVEPSPWTFKDRLRTIKAAREGETIKGA